MNDKITYSLTWNGFNLGDKWTSLDNVRKEMKRLDKWDAEGRYTITKITTTKEIIYSNDG